MMLYGAQLQVGTNKKLPRDKTIKDTLERTLLFNNRKYNKQHITKQSKEINVEIRKYREKLRTETIQFHLTKSGRLKKAWKELQKSSSWINNITHHKIKKRNSKRTEILEAANDFYQELYNDE